MLLTGNFEGFARRFQEPGLDLQTQLGLATEIRDSIEIVHTSEYGNFLRHMFPVFCEVLEKSQPCLTEGPQHKIRNILLEILHRLPNNEVLRPYVQTLIKLALKLLEKENEENAVICLRIIFELHKNYRPNLETEVQPFLDFVKRIYNNLPTTVNSIFNKPAGAAPPQGTGQQAQPGAANPAAQPPAQGGAVPSSSPTAAAGAAGTTTQAPAAAAAPGATNAPNGEATPMQVDAGAGAPDGGAATAAPGQAAPPQTGAAGGDVVADGGAADAQKQPNNDMTESIQSFKVLTECPLTVMLLFQIYPRHIPSNIPQLIPLMVRALALKASVQTSSHRQPYQDFLAAQVKTLSFLTYLLRAFADYMQRYQDSIPKCVIQLLSNCPNESVMIRKDVLVATRHILATDFRVGFFSQVDLLLDEKLLVGSGRSSQEVLRPLAYSTLADLVHHVRGELTLPQFSKIVYIFSRNIHDPSLPIGIQTTSVRLLLNVVEHIYKSDQGADYTKGRALLVRILDTFVRKFGCLKKYIPKLIKQAEGGDEKEKDGGATLRTGSKSIRAGVPEGNTDSVKDCKQLLKTMILGLKIVVASIINCRSRSDLASQGSGAPAPRERKGLQEEECLTITRLLKDGLECFQIYSKGPNASAAEEKEVLDYFAGVFTVLDPRNFQDIINMRMNILFEFIQNHQAFLNIPQHFLANSHVSRIFAELLLNFLLGRLKSLGHTDEKDKESNPDEASVLLRLFKILFGSLQLFPENEHILKPYLGLLVTSCMKFATEVKDPLNYLSLLRLLFRSIAGRDLLYKEFLPLLPPLLDGLIRLQKSAYKHNLKELFVELCLSLPARLSSLLPYLYLLMRPLVHALQSEAELVSLGLRTLEFWIDNLKADFLYPLLNRVLPELMVALSRHLKPHPYPHGTAALRILGKMGGRARNQRIETKLDFRKHKGDGFCVDLAFPGVKSNLTLPMDSSLSHCRAVIVAGKAPKYHKTQCFDTIRACFAALINFESDPAAFTYCPPVDDNDHSDVEGAIHARGLTSKDEKKLNAYGAGNEVLNCMLTAVFHAAADEELKDVALPLLQGLCRHFALIYVARGSSTDAIDPGVELNPGAFLDALEAALTSDKPLVPDAALKGLESFVECCVTICDSKNVASTYPVFEDLAARFCHCCYKREWFHKNGGCVGISCLSSSLSVYWVRKHEIQFVRSLIFVFKDTPREVSLMTSEKATEALNLVFKICNSSQDRTEEHKEMFDNLLSLLTAELYHENQTVRKQAQNALQELAKLTNKSCTELLQAQYEANILKPILDNRKSPTVPVQIGCLTALTFCMTLRPPLVTVTPEIMTVLNEASAITETDDQNASKLLGPKNSHMMTRLRTVCIELLSAAMTLPDFNDNDLRNKIVQMFFKSLTLRSKDIVVAAKDGLAQAIQQQKLHKDLLQASLRPVLKYLADYKMLSLPVLQGLARLVELLSNFFNVTLGEKLLEHLKKWTEPEKIAQQRVWKQGEEPKIAASIIDLFHLLPPAPDKFLDPLVTTVIQLEPLLPQMGAYSEVSSLYRAPLTRYMNKNPSDAVDYFLARLNVSSYSKLFQFMVRSEIGAALRDEIAQSPKKIIASCFKVDPKTMSSAQEITTLDADVKRRQEELQKAQQEVASIQAKLQQEQQAVTQAQAASNATAAHEAQQRQLAAQHQANAAAQAVQTAQQALQSAVTSLKTARAQHHAQLAEIQFQGICLVRSLVKFKEDWLSENKDVLDCLVDLWTSPVRTQRLAMEESLPLPHIRESKLIIKCFLNYCRKKQEEVSLLFHMLTIFTQRTIVDFSFLKQFYTHDVAEDYPVEHKKAIIKYFLTFFQNPKVTQEQKVQALQLLIIPVLTASFQKGEEGVLDQESISTIISRLLGSEPLSSYDEGLRIELLQLATLMIRYIPNGLVDYRKELIKFAWNHLKSEDTTSKQCAYVNVCRFIDVYETPPKIILQVYVALLRTFQPESRALVKQALDILTPAMPKRLPAGDHKYPTWIKWTKKIIVEEGHSLPQLIHIWQLLVRHPQLFYASRAQFVPQMVNSLNRIGLPPTCPPENRKLAVDLAELIVRWEQQRVNDKEKKGIVGLKRPSTSDDANAAKKTKTEGGAQEVPPSPMVDDEFKPSPAMVEMVVNFLIRMSFTTCDSKDSPELSGKCIDLLGQAFRVWPDANVKFVYFDKLISSNAGTEYSSSFVTGIECVSVILDIKSQLPFIQSHISSIQQIISPCFSKENTKEVTTFCKFLKKMLKAFPLSGTNLEVSNFYRHVGEILENTLQTHEKTNTQHSLQGAMMALKVLCDVQANYLERPNIAPLLVKVFQKMAKDYIGGVHTLTGKDPGKVGAKESVHHHSAGAAARKNTQQQPDKDEVSPRDTLILSMKLIASRILHLGDNRKLFFQSLTLLIEKSQEAPLLLEVTKIIGEWIMLPENANPTLSVKDKANFLLKMTCFEQLPHVNLQREFLLIVLKLYSDRSLEKSELWNKVEKAFMIGLRSKDPEIRAKFFQIFDKNLESALTQRMHYILHGQDWESLSDSFWLKHGLDLLLSVAKRDGMLVSSPPSCSLHLPTLGAPKIKAARKAPKGELAKQLLLSHNSFLLKMREVKLDNLMKPLSELIHEETELAAELWALVFPFVWGTMDRSDHTTLSKHICTLLAKDYHTKQQTSKPNCVQALLDGFLRCDPPPKLNKDLVRHLAKSSNAWQAGMGLLERDLNSGTHSADGTHESLVDILSALGEEDVVCGVWRRRAVAPETKQGIMLSQQGMWQKAQEVFFAAMNKAQAGNMSSGVPKSEMCVWEKRWIDCAKHLNQWDVLSEFSRQVGYVDTLLECNWIQGEWAPMKDLFAKHPGQDQPLYKLLQGFMAIQEGKLADSATFSQVGIQSALQRWCELPSLRSVAHSPLLEVFQQLVELQESIQVLEDIAQTQRRQTPDIKNFMNTWRERLPSKWDDITTWASLFGWRNQMFTVMTSTVTSMTDTSGLTNTCNHEAAWCHTRFAHIARKHGLGDVCLISLAKLHSLQSMDVQEYFVKLREQVKVHLLSATEHRTALNVLATANTDPITSPEQQAEIHQLKGELMYLLGQSEDANAAFSNSLGTCDTLARGWVSWGSYCDEMFMENKEMQWADNAVNCYLQGIRYNSNRARMLLARVLWLLGGGEEANSIRTTFENFGNGLPVWIWLPWIPHLLNALERAESVIAKNILCNVSAKYPQAVYYNLRTMMMHHGIEDVAAVVAASPAASPPAASPPAASPPAASPPSGTDSAAPMDVDAGAGAVAKETGPAAYMKEIMQALRGTHTMFTKNVERLLTEVSKKLHPPTEVALLTGLERVLNRALEVNTAMTQVPAEWMSMLEDLFRDVGMDDPDRLTPYLRSIKDGIEGDLKGSIPDIATLIKRINKWRSNLENRPRQGLYRKHLERLSPTLCEFQLSDLEIPGQYHEGREPVTDQHTLFDRLIPTLELTRRVRQGSSYRLIFRGFDGLQYPFLLQAVPATTARADERLVELMRTFNYAARKHRECAKRGIGLDIVNAVPIMPGLRLVVDDGSSLTMADVQERVLMRQGKDADTSVNDFAAVARSADQKKKLNSFKELNTMTSDQVILQYVSDVMTSHDALFAFKKQFATYTALTSALGHMLSVGNRTPDRILMSMSRLTLSHMDFHPSYNSKGGVESTDPVPFRLTRNMMNVMGPASTDGWFSAAFLAFSQALAMPSAKPIILSHLHVYFRDDMLAWAADKTNKTEESPAIEPCSKEIVANATTVYDRMKAIAAGNTHKENKTQELIRAAIKPESLCQSSAAWQAWY